MKEVLFCFLMQLTCQKSGTEKDNIVLTVNPEPGAKQVQGRTLWTVYDSLELFLAPAGRTSFLTL